MARRCGHIERAREGESRNVEVEIIVNGRPAARKQLLADGRMKELKFPLLLKESSWVAARILPSSHTNPIWVTVDGKPVRASRRSAEWCLRGVNDCWNQKKKFIGEDEMEDAENAYAHARSTYRRILAESPAP